MNEMDRIVLIKKDFLKLYELKEDKIKYDTKIEELCNDIENLKLPHLIDPVHIKFLFIVEMGNMISNISFEEFRDFVDNSFKKVESAFYFHKPELFGFPNNIFLGHGKLINYESLPLEVKIFSNKIFSREYCFKDPLVIKAFGLYLQDNIAISDPKKGSWLEIKTSSITFDIRHKNAFEKAEESLDVLRIIKSPYKLNTIQYAIVLNEDEKDAFPTSIGLSGLRYEYDQDIQKAISIFSNICLNPKNDVENRLKNALYFKRIGDNFAPDHFKIFFYIAGIENLILGGDDRDVLRWKFAQKGAILLDKNSERRHEISRELKEMYDLRSKIAHGGKSEYDYFKTIRAKDYLHNMIVIIINLLNKEKIKVISRDGKRKNASLDEYVDKIIFSE